MAALFGTTPNEFDPAKEDWTQYVETLEQFFVANSIEEVEKQWAM